MTLSQPSRQPPIHELLSRIRWDPSFGRGQFELGYWDRVSRQVVRVSMAQVHVNPSDPFALRVLDSSGRLVNLPYHRVVELWRDGELIWQRHTPEQP